MFGKISLSVPEIFLLRSPEIDGAVLSLAPDTCS